MTSFMQNPRKCKLTYSDRKLCNWLGFDGWWARYDENGQGEITKNKMRVFQTMNVFITLIIVMISWIFTYIMLQSMGSQRVRHGWATELNWTDWLTLSFWKWREMMVKMMMIKMLVSFIVKDFGEHKMRKKRSVF